MQGGFIFVSHASADRAAAQALAAQLESEGAKIWIAPRDVNPGRDYSEQLDEAIAGCAALVLVASAAAGSSSAVRGETEQAARDGKPIFPVRLADVDVAAAFPMLGELKYWTDGFGPNAGRNVGRLAEELAALGGHAPAAPPPAPAPAPAPVAAPAIPTAPPAPAMAPPAPAYAPPPAPAYVPPPAAPTYAPLTPPPVAGDQNELLRAFIGNNAERYQRVFYKMEASQSAVSWNWSAFLASFIWLAHRRLFVPAGIVAVPILVSILIGGLFKGDRTMMALFGIGIPGLVAAGVGMFGDLLLKKRADAVIMEMQYRYPDPSSHLPAIAASGGTSPPATIGVTVAWLALITGLQLAGLTPFEKRQTVYYYRY